MARKKLIEEILLNPARYYRVPGDVVRDRRFDDPERLAILAAWERQADADMLAPLHQARQDIESKAPIAHAARKSGH